MRVLARVLRWLPLLLLSPLLILVSLLGLLAADLLFALTGRRKPAGNTRPRTDAASVVIPNWNGRDLLEKYLPSVIRALEGNPENEVIVVDNGSEDGSAEFLRERFPQVRLLALPTNLGFGGGSNAGFAAARNDIVILLNSDMRVDPDFLGPLLRGFTDGLVFSVSCQIFFSDPNRVREETGLTEGWWENGSLRVRHRIDDRVDRLFPCFYGGGGSCAFDRRKFLELGGFDPLLAPFYLEDTDLGYLAWKRGWKVLYQPASHVYHEHRGTIGKKFTAEQIQAVLHKNFLLFAWKNVHEWRRLTGHFAFAFAGGLVSAVFGDSLERASLGGIWKAFRQLPGAMRSRQRAHSLAVCSDTEALRRPYGGYFRDRFEKLPPAPTRASVLFVSPYPICPPVHGGAVFMHQTCRYLAPLVNLHLVVNLDRAGEEAAHEELGRGCSSAEFLIRGKGARRPIGSITPHAIQEFASDQVHWTIHRKIYLDEVDIVQLEYLTMGQYAGEFRQIACCLFDHDIYFQSIGRSLRGAGGLLAKMKPAYEYVRALRYELNLLPRLDRVQVCSRENASYLKRFRPELHELLDDEHRAGIDVGQYEFRTGGREPKTMLFLGSFRHGPNLSALQWLSAHVLPLVLQKEPDARLIIVGSDPPARHSLNAPSGAIELRGFVPDIREPLSRYAVFVCPILSGSGMRVKLLEAFASGIPAVSTRLGAEGLGTEDGTLCALADDPAGFADRVVRLFRDPQEGEAMALRARAEVEARRDLARLTEGLAEDYRQLLAAKREARNASPHGLSSDHQEDAARLGPR